MTQFHNTSPFFGSNAVFVEELYERYLLDNNSVDPSWQKYFSQLGDLGQAVLDDQKKPSWQPEKEKTKVIGVNYEEPVKSTAKDGAKPQAAGALSEQACTDSINAFMLIRAYKVRGSLLANLDPLGLEKINSHPDLDITTYGFSEKDYDKKIYLGGALGLKEATLKELVQLLKQIYSSNIGFEFMHIPSMERRDWISNKIEQLRGRPLVADEQKKKILNDMIEFESFEEFLHKKFPGAKRFSAEGGESSFAGIERIIQLAASKFKVKEVVLGMAHRGRLNVLTKVMGRRYASLLSEFQGRQAYFSEELDATGDVKYHQGASSDRDIDGNKIHLSLNANPSHLEAVNPVVVGRVRAKQDQLLDVERKQVLGILIHGDAAFCGQGVVTETLSLGELESYCTGGTINIVINNQIGFTTSARYSRKSPFPTDVAKGAHAPIFHVNGDDPEAVIFVSELALEYRQTFGVDVVIDVFCYRRYGHNEGDEPLFTQPIMYHKIKDHPTIMNLYGKKLIADKVITADEFKAMQDKFTNFLEDEYKASQNYKADDADWLKGKWNQFKSPARGEKKEIDTGVAPNLLKTVGTALATYPEGFNINPKLIRLMEAKKEMLKTGKDVDWALAEALAFGTLLTEGYNVRLSGQDCIRGTFSHRHSGLIDQVTEQRYFPLNNLGVKQGRYEGIDSNLSEYAVLGYEYGYSLAEPNTLVLWEGQFGDFANGAQIMFDQFISSSEIKWLRFSGLVVLLPHGYEGQGPEHSSARLERFLQLCAQDNMQVVNCTTPANYYHVLRRQLTRDFRKPLIVMSPKSLLRHKKCVSELKEFTKGNSFKPVIGETQELAKADTIKKVILCSGKVYYDLLEEREKRKIKNIALIRLEQYYPFPEKALKQELKQYTKADLIWCQEEPENMGAWHFLDRRVENLLKELDIKAKRPSYVGRKAAAATAAGYLKIHNKELSNFIDEAFKV